METRSGPQLDIDVDARRSAEIRWHGLTAVDEAFTLYYDETNNVRRLHLTAGAFNVAEPEPFVLGGVAHRGPPRTLDISSLRQALRLQANVGEIKLKHLGRGDFLSLLAAPRVGVWLEWMLAEPLFVHFQVLDPIYWSLVDIVDSVVFEAGPLLMMAADEVKDALYAALKSDLAATADLLHRYGYPGLGAGDVQGFLAALAQLIIRAACDLTERQLSLLEALLEAASDRDELALIQGGDPSVLIDGFSGFYLHRLCLFARAQHVLDAEPRVRATLSTYRLVSGGQELRHYRFVDSKADPAIQLSDLTAGLFGRYYSYLISTPADRLADDKRRLTPAQLRHLRILAELVDRADAICPAFFHHVTSLSTRERNRSFLHR